MSFFQSENVKTTDFNGMRLKLASPEAIRGWSYGEVTKPETINYRTQKPEKSGLFAEEIFGPSKDWECYCGKYKKIRYKGIVCDKCGVEVTHSLVRRERMAHIELATPVTHIWFLRSVPSRIGTILDVSVVALEKVVYFAAFIVTSVNEELKQQVIDQLATEYKGKRKQIEMDYEREVTQINEKANKEDTAAGAVTKELDKAVGNKDRKLKELETDVSELEKELKTLQPLKIISENEYHEYSLKFGHIFEAKIGAEALDELLKKIDVEATMAILREELAHASGAKYEHIIRRLKLLKSFTMHGIDPHWMILKVVPVIPPDLRPMVALDGGRFATSDLNDLYRRVINRNNRLKRLLELHAPEVITRNEKRMLQEAVDALIDNSARHSKTVIAATGKKRQLKSLADILKGKQGRFRQNLLGKRVDYSGRSVIVVGPNLKMHQCGLPKIMALELFRPFIIAQLIKREIVHNIRSANRYIEGDNAEVWDILENIANNAVVLLNRAPTLHRLGIQGFQPVLIEGKAIQIHPLVCSAFNADFDGDQMAVHVPLTEEAQWEAREIMLSTKNMLKPATGNPVTTPAQDIVWGVYYMTTMLETEADTKIKTFGTTDEAIYTYQAGYITARDKIKVRLGKEQVITETTVGRILFSRLLPEGMPFVNERLGKKQIGEIAQRCIDQYGFQETAMLLDRMKEFGYRYITLSGFSYGIGDLPRIPEKDGIMEEASGRVLTIEDQYKEGLLTKRERYTQIIKVWSDIQDRIKNLSKMALDPKGSLSAMIESGARGSVVQLMQVVGMKGLVTNPTGEIIELPIKSSFREGLDVLEYFISSHGTRKGLTDTALKTANAGYLTRRLVDVSQDVIITSEDCGDQDGFLLTHEECEDIGESLLTRIVGRVSAEDVTMPRAKKPLIQKGEMIIDEHIIKLKTLEKPLPQIRVRSVMTCKNTRGLCQKCYGFDLAYNKEAKLGAAVGVVAAQSVGEPGTQLTMRTFHTGGVASGQDITQGLPRVEELFEARNPKHAALMATVSGKISIVEPEAKEIKTTTGQHLVDTARTGKIIRIMSNQISEDVMVVTSKDSVKVKDGDKVEEGEILIVRHDGTEIVAQHDGTIKHVKNRLTVIWEGLAATDFPSPLGFRILVKDGDEAAAGDQLTEGHLDLQLLFRTKGHKAVMQYLLKEVLSIYATQGQKINSKHIELLIRQMFSRSYVKDAGDTELLPGEIVERSRAQEENDRVAANGGKVAELDSLFMGITKVALTTESFLSSASFQETARVLIHAAITGKVDHLEGLKENVIIGRLIPAGTGFGYHHPELNLVGIPKEELASYRPEPELPPEELTEVQPTENNE
ncbi:MAG: DNA-directed RNA polymerase subunit beta' [Patescibacteria group bacterium]|nr:DNA-directed RNA polymerase subunit beta' [Patescibacteria group bacterium]